MILEAADIHAYYGLSHILQGINLALEEGKILCLLGRNGMGKSTTLKAMMGLVPPRKGHVRYRGRDITGWPPHRIAMAGIGYVPEERRIFSKISVRDNLLLGIKAAPDHASKREQWHLDRVFKHFPVLKERQNNRGAHLSGGEQQMLCIARALMGNPDVLLVDEPSEGLAPIIVKEVRDVLAEINLSGVSVVLVEHNLEVAMSLAHEILLMGKGHIGYRGTVADLQQHPEILADYLEV